MVLSTDSNEPHPVSLASEYERILGTDWTKSFLQIKLLTFSFQKFSSLTALSQSDKSNYWSQETRDSIVLYKCLVINLVTFPKTGCIEITLPVTLASFLADVYGKVVNIESNDFNRDSILLKGMNNRLLYVST